MRVIIIKLKITLILIIINVLKRFTMSDKTKEVVTLIVQFVVTLLGTLLGINL